MPLNAAKAMLTEVVNDTGSSSTDIKSAIKEGLNVVELVNYNVEGVILPVSTIAGAGAFIALGYGAITAFSGIDENGNDGTAY